MKFYLKPTDPSKIEADILIKYCWEKEVTSLSGLPKNFTDEIQEICIKENFKGEENQAVLVYPKGHISSFKFLLFGLGSKKECDLHKLYKLIASSVKKSLEGKPVKIAIIMDDYLEKHFSVQRIVRVMTEAAKLSTYRFIKYKGDEEKQKNRPIEEVIFAVTPSKISSAEEAIHIGEIFSDATIFARNLINEPSEITTPSFLAQTAQELAKSSEGKIKVKVFEEEEIRKLGMNAFLGVSAGSDKSPKFIHLSYKPSGSFKKIVIIGKGITFDTGGLSLKTSEHMETMKMDMSGAAAVLAIFSVLPILKPKSEVVGLIAACENMPSGKALKPGDILKVMNGKTIEVLNTDAEGRLTLADAISFANLKEKADEIIDLATLTGACMVALGTEVAGMWGNEEKLLENLKEAAQKSGEYVWPMPLLSEYKPLIKSHIADVKNTQTGRYAGAITASLFLSEFVGNTPWVHLDIAGPAYTEKETPLAPIGGAGFGVRMLLEYLLK